MRMSTPPSRSTACLTRSLTDPLSVTSTGNASTLVEVSAESARRPPPTAAQMGGQHDLTPFARQFQRRRAPQTATSAGHRHVGPPVSDPSSLRFTSVELRLPLPRSGNGKPYGCFPRCSRIAGTPHGTLAWRVKTDQRTSFAEFALDIRQATILEPLDHVVDNLSGSPRRRRSHRRPRPLERPAHHHIRSDHLFRPGDGL